MAENYGIAEQKVVNSKLERHLEELDILGFTVIEDALNPEEIKECESKVISLYQKTEKDLGISFLEGINDLDMLRSPLVYDEFFLKIATNSTVMSLVEKLLGVYFTLHLQNAIINMPDKVHNQRSWHRDLPYQNYVISKPISISALFCINDFDCSTGATELLPFSHKYEELFSNDFIENHKITLNAKAGSVVLFNSMLFHRAGVNNSNKHRIGINHMYTVPIIKQQIDLPKALNGKYQEDEFLAKFLGYTSQAAENDLHWRQRQAEKNQKKLKL